MRLLLKRLVGRAEGYQLVGEAENGEDLLRLYDSEKPDMVILDVEMPGMTGSSAPAPSRIRTPARSSSL
jgi:YesN/AraC family two-component response regulator